MPSQESILREQYTALLAEFSASFPDLSPPDASFWFEWMKKYDSADIHSAIQTLSVHPLKHKFSSASCGRAISAMLRESALRRVLASPTKTEEPRS
jgi:hypothetical protein